MDNISENYCLICSKQFKSKLSFDRHMKQRHISKNVHECVLCSESFPKAEQLIEHILEHKKNPSKPFGCALCSETFEEARSLDAHVETHSGSAVVRFNKENLHDCSECGLCFSSSIQLCRHRRDKHSENRYKCSQCGMAFLRVKELRIHFRIHQGLSFLRCDCSSIFASLRSYEAHLPKCPVLGSSHDPLDENVEEAQKLKCPHCDLKFLKSSTIRIHIGRNHPDVETKSETCPLCDGLTFSSRSALEEHFRKIHGSFRPFRCHQCGTCFAKLRTLQDHVSAHLSSFRCEYCTKPFLSKSSLLKHYKKHEGLDDQEVFLCPHCNIPYVEEVDLTKHLKQHENVLEHFCQYLECGKVFLSSSERKKHERLHTREKPFGPCGVCGKSFAYRTSLKTHQLTHTKERNFMCNTCGKTFQSKCNLQVHLRIHTGDRPFSCQICSKAFVTSGNLSDHMKTHTGLKDVKCDMCGKEFSHLSSLKKHKVLHTGEKNHVCEVCGRGFSQMGHLQEHRRIHTGERPFSCHICLNKFRRKDTFKAHLNMHAKKTPEEVLETDMQDSLL